MLPFDIVIIHVFSPDWTVEKSDEKCVYHDAVFVEADVIAFK
jgi:hypothetical protein